MFFIYKVFLSLVVILLKISLIISVPVDENFNYCEGLKAGLTFFKAQRAGVNEPESEFPWQSNITTKFDTYKNGELDENGIGYLSRGYFDAGDYLKITNPLSFSMTALSWSFLEFKDNIEKCGLLEVYLSAIKTGVNWLIAAHPEPNIVYRQCGVVADHYKWERPYQIYVDQNGQPKPRDCTKQIIDVNNPSSDIVLEMVATMSAASKVFESIDPEYSNLCKKHALQLWDFGINHQGIPSYSEMYDSLDFQDEIVWASAWLSFIDRSNENHYKTYYQGKCDKLKYSNSYWDYVYSWANKLSAACIFIEKNLNENQGVSNSIINYWNTKIPKTKDGIFFIDKWGNNRYSLGGCLLEAIWNNNNNNNNNDSIVKTNFSKKQIEIILGNNSNHYSYVSQFGFKSSKLPLNIHHRSSHNPINFDKFNPINNQYPIVGALLPGPTDLNDNYYEDRNNYEMNEPALDYNSVFVGVMASLINEKSSSVKLSFPIYNENNDPNSVLGFSFKLLIPLQLIILNLISISIIIFLM
ncbi:hypothetical protein RB653_001585 [Dictyostelium firmibasis]|uniref:cellulase n=1 Tax=Dictyostelium firmibasis TaxID=79012 RepID=A0AAN7TX90_9MYCE